MTKVPATGPPKPSRKAPAGYLGLPRSNANGRLSADAQRWFDSVIESYVLEPHHRKLLTLACQAWDRAQAAYAALNEHGQVYYDNGKPRPRPETVIAKDQTIAFARLVRELDLDVEGPTDGRRPAPPALRSNRRV